MSRLFAHEHTVKCLRVVPEKEPKCKSWLAREKLEVEEEKEEETEIVQNTNSESKREESSTK